MNIYSAGRSGTIHQRRVPAQPFHFDSLRIGLISRRDSSTPRTRWAPEKKQQPKQKHRQSEEAEYFYTRRIIRATIHQGDACAPASVSTPIFNEQIVFRTIPRRQSIDQAFPPRIPNGKRVKASVSSALPSNRVACIKQSHLLSRRCTLAGEARET